MKRKLAILTCIAMIITLLPTYAMAMDEGQSDGTSLDQLQEMQLDDADQPQVKDEEQSDSAGLKLPPAVKPGDAEVTPRLKSEGQNKGQIKDEVLKLLEKQYSIKDLEVDEYYDYVEIIRPAWQEVIYRGEVLWTDYWQYDTYEDYWTCPIEVLWDPYDNIVFEAEYPYDWVDLNDWTEWSGQVNINSAKLAPGVYELWVINAPVDSDYYILDDWSDIDVPFDFMQVIIKNFNAPSALKAKAGKKKVTVSFRGSEGATSYQIFRSKKKGSGYKCIATTTKTKYVDKKAKKGKKYYYKVRAVRKAPYKNAIYSGYTAPKKTKKVK